MYAPLLVIHSVTRWLLVLLHLGRVTRSGLGWQQGRAWDALDHRIGLAALIVTDVQLLFGLGLYFGGSPSIAAAMSDVGAAMKDPVLRFWLVEHPTTMILAIVAAHVGHAISKRRTAPAEKHRAAFLGSLATLVLVAAGVPWPWRAGIGRPLFPGA